MSVTYKGIAISLTTTAILGIFLSACGGGSADSSGPVMIRPDPSVPPEPPIPITPEPPQPGAFAPTCADGLCSANYHGQTLQAGSFTDGTGGFVGTAFAEFYGPLPQGGTATYAGETAFRLNPRTPQATDEYGTVTLTTDFGASTIGGTVNGKDGSSVQLTLNPATPLPNDSFTYFEASPRHPSPSGDPPITCRTGITCDGGQWWGEFGHEDTVGAFFLAEQNGRRVIEGGLIGAKTKENPRPDDTTTVPDPDPTVDWLLSGTVSSTAARGEAERTKNAIEDARDPNLSNYGSVVNNTVGGHHGGGPAAIVFTGPGPNYHGAYPDYAGSWGYWNDPAMSAAITKIQEVFHGGAPPLEAADNPEVVKRVIGLMDNGYFGIAHSSGHVANPGTSYSYDVASNFGAFYEANDVLSMAMGDHTYLRDYGLVGATWSGDALGFDKASETAVFGPASLAITSEADCPPNCRSDYHVRLNVDWTNGDSVELTGFAGGGDDIGLPLSAFNGAEYGTEPSSPTHRFRGHFAGIQAEEAFGVFETPEYIGAFGAKRK